MIKLVVFDLDGVLVKAKEIHYHALNKALGYIDVKYIIPLDEHLAKYDGLPTAKKLERLTVDKGLSVCKHDLVWKLKQKYTIEVIEELVYSTDYIQQQEMLEKLLKDNYKIYVASNSITESIRCMLKCSGLIQYIHRYYSNEDVRNPKPHSEIYLRCMVDAGVNPKETLIIEDSHIGRKSAHESGAHVFGVRGVDEVNYSNVVHAINKANKYKMFRPKWQGGKMNVLIPMAGAGTRFEQAGYTFPKPLIEVLGKPMIQLVVENINVDARHIFICQKKHYEKYNLQHVLKLIQPNCEIVQVDGITEGAACTTLLAKEFINNDEQLLIANSDQYVEWDSNEFLYACNSDSIDGGILTFYNTHPMWSYAKIDQYGFVTEVAEKVPISTYASVGIYSWAHGSDYVKYAEQMIRKNIRTNNEFYVCPVFNEAIADGKKFKIFNIDKMEGLGTPEQLNAFINHHE
jgi:beta-phosphoglucomutase-like phosphatase (HAD superfamily)/dTDP-glucose pyrophosphorylase